MAWRPLPLTATTVLAAALFAAADTPKPTPIPSPGAPAAKGKRSASPAPKAASPSPAPSTAPGHVFTNEDLPAQPSPAVIASPGPAGTGRGTVTTLPKSSDVPLPRSAPEGGPSQAAAQEVEWRARATALRDAITGAEKSIPEIEDRIAGLRNDRNPTNLMDPNREQHRQAEIAKAQAELESAKAALEASRQALANLEEEARRKGIPPGWLVGR
jgi:hypothetical protein